MLTLYRGKFNANIALNVESKKEKERKRFALLNIPELKIKIYIDASLSGWGITDGTTPSEGRWDKK